MTPNHHTIKYSKHGKQGAKRCWEKTISTGLKQTEIGQAKETCPFPKPHKSHPEAELIT